MYRSFDPKNQGPRDKAVARAEKNSAANFCKFFAIDEAKVTLAALIQWQRCQDNSTSEGKMDSKIKAGRKYQTRNGYAVEIDCLNSQEGARNPDGEARVLGRIFFSTQGWLQATWDLNGRASINKLPGDFDLVDAGKDERDKLVTIGDAIAIREIDRLLEYVFVDGVDQEVFSDINEADLCTQARVVFGLLKQAKSL
jgi:hypothetical protein